MSTHIDSTAVIHPDAIIGEGVRIYGGTYVGATAQIGDGTTIGRNCEIHGIIGKHCKIQAAALIYDGVTIGNWCFIGPRFTTTNDIDPDAYSDDWSDRKRQTDIGHGVCIGASVTVLCGLYIGNHARIGCGSLVLKPVKPRYRAFGNPCTHRSQIPLVGDGDVKVAP